MHELNSTTLKGQCVLTCSDGYYLSFDSAFLWNPSYFQDQEYSDFVDNVMQQQKNSNKKQKEIIGFINQNEPINIIPNGFDTDKGIIISQYLKNKIKMACIICQSKCSKCPEGYFLNLQNYKCVKQCSESRQVLNKQCTNQRNTNPNYKIKCLSCDPDGKQYFRSSLVLLIDTEDILTAASWRVLDITGINYILDEKSKFKLLEIANLSKNIVSTVLYTIEENLIGRDVIYTFQFEYYLNNAIKKYTKMQIEMTQSSTYYQYRQLDQLGIWNEMFNFYNSSNSAQKNESLNNISTEFLNLKHEQISYFFPQPYFSVDNFAIKLLITYQKMKNFFYLELPLSNQFSGNIGLEKYTQFIPFQDFLKVTFCLIRKDNYLEKKPQTNYYLIGSSFNQVPKIEYLKTISIKMSKKYLDLETIISNYNKSTKQVEVVYIFNIVISLYRQMLFSELYGKQAFLNDRISDQYDNTIQEEEIDEKIFTVEDYLKTINSKNHNFRALEKDYFSQIIKDQSKQNQIIFLQDCSITQNSTYGYFCKLTSKQNSYFQNSLQNLLNKFIQILSSSNQNIFYLNESQEKLIRSLQYLTRFSQNSQKTYQQYLVLLQMLLSNNQNTNNNAIVAELIIDINEMILRNKIDKASFIETLNFVEKSMNNISNLSLQTQISNLLITQIELKQYSIEIEIGINSQDESKLNVLSQQNNKQIQSLKIISYTTQQSAISIQNKFPGQVISNHVSLIFSEKIDKYRVEFQLQTKISKRNLLEKTYKYECFNSQQNKTDDNCSLNILSLNKIECICSSIKTDLMIIQILIEQDKSIKSDGQLNDFIIINQLFQLNNKFIQSIFIVSSVYLFFPILLILRRQKLPKTYHKDRFTQNNIKGQIITQQIEKQQQVKSEKQLTNLQYNNGNIQEKALKNFSNIEQPQQPNKNNNNYTLNTHNLKSYESSEKIQIGFDDKQNESILYQNHNLKNKGPQTKVIDSIKQIREDKSIYINSLPDNMKGMKIDRAEPIQKQFTCSIFIEGIVYGVKRPYSLLLSEEEKKTIFIYSLIQILQSQLGTILIRFIDQIWIICAAMIFTHQCCVVIQNLIRQQKMKTCLLITYMIFLIIIYIIYFYFQMYINTMSQLDFDQWCKRSFKITIIEVFLLQTLNSIYTVMLFINEVKFKLLIDHQSCLYFFKFKQLKIPSIFDEKQNKYPQIKNPQKINENESPISYYKENQNQTHKIQIEGKNKKMSEDILPYEIQQNKINNILSDNRPSQLGNGTLQVLSDILGELDYQIQNYQIRQNNPQSSCIISESTSQDVIYKQSNAFNNINKQKQYNFQALGLKKQIEPKLIPNQEQTNNDQYKILITNQNQNYEPTMVMQQEQHSINIDNISSFACKSFVDRQNMFESCVDAPSPIQNLIQNQNKYICNLEKKIQISEQEQHSSIFPNSIINQNDIPIEKSSSNLNSVRNFNQIIHQQK